jgi:hypothetical protein
VLPVSFYVFPGYPAYLELAATELGHPESASAAGRIVPLTALSNLCAQATQGNPAHVRGILAKAVEFRDHLAVALRAAELMLADVEAARRCSTPENRVEIAPSAIPASSADLRRPRKGPATSRESS